jgi:transposase
MKVKQEKLEWLADNPFYSKRFAFFVGRRCRAMTIKDVAQETHLDWKTVKELDKQYMQEQLRRIGTPAAKVVGVDEIAIRKGPHLSHRRQSPFASPPDLVWRPGPLGTKHG